MLGMAGLRPVHDDRIVGAPEQIAAAIENPGARAAGADVDGADQLAQRFRRRHGFAAGEQVRKVAHVVEYQVGLHRLERGEQSGALGMRAAGEGEDPHAGVLGRGDAGRAILDHRAIFGRDAHLARHMQEKIGRRLAARHHRGAENVRLEEVAKAGDLERQPDALELARRRDAALAADAGERLGDAGDGFQIAAKALVDRRPHAIEMAIGDHQAELVAQHAVDGRHAAAEEALIGDRLADLATGLGDQRKQHLDRDRLAVDQHAVAIEDDQFGAVLGQRATPSS